VAKPDPILTVDHLRRWFEGLLAVDVEHVELQRGAVTALIGPNGAGKTTFFNLVSGFDRSNGGRWSFNGRDVTRRSAHRIATGGMVRTFQLTKSLMRMRVIDNMRLAAKPQRGESFVAALVPPLWRSQERAITARAEALLERFDMAHMRDEYAGTLSGGQRKLLEMARALMVEPELLMLDEPMAGVNPALAPRLLDHVRRLPQDLGTTVVFVEHEMDVVMGISDWVVCMADGRIIAEGPPASIGANQAVIDAYLGGRHDSATDRTEDGSGGAVHVVERDQP
jgi:branched-chain amino acid transport system ATP-binding protein